MICFLNKLIISTEYTSIYSFCMNYYFLRETVYISSLLRYLSKKKIIDLWNIVGRHNSYRFKNPLFLIAFSIVPLI